MTTMKTSSRRVLSLAIGLGVYLLSGFVLQTSAAQEWRSAISVGDYARARVELESALEVQPGDTALRYELARVLGYAGLNEESLAEYDSLLSRHPDNADYLLGRAQTLARLGRTTEALRVTERALGLAPEYEDLWRLRLQLAERAADDESTEALRIDIASRYPNAAWWRRSSRTIEHTRWISVGGEQNRLSNDAPDWSRQFVRLDWQSDSAAYFGEAASSSRFGRNDQSLSIGGDWQALATWRLGGALSAASNADFEPARALSVNAGRAWQSAWGTQFQLRHREYSNAVVSGYTVTGDRYFSDYRVAYGLNYSRLHGAGSSLGHTVAFGWYPTEQNSLAISLGAGDEIETVGLDRLLRTDVKNVTLSGRQLLLTRFTLSWWIGTHRQGDFYRRKYAGISVRFGI